MAFFSKNVSPPANKTNGPHGAISSVICQDMHIGGEISFSGKARIDGAIEGDVKGEHLIVSESGRIKGDLDLASLICHGSIEGNVRAQDVIIHSSAILHGNLTAGNLSVEPGAKLSGEISAAAQQKQAETSGVPPLDKTEGSEP